MGHGIEYGVQNTKYDICTWDTSIQGSLPTEAPVNPYTELALSFSASCLPSSTFFLNGSVSRFNSSLALYTVTVQYVTPCTHESTTDSSTLNTCSSEHPTCRQPGISHSSGNIREKD